ncbi:Transcription factor TFIIIB component B'' [Gossypium australe]|uniref:Transcription factor TFIIIB component B n=1 Tax=Gossypium australe TaxID=47621 RepID=A0A5B6VL75_9ROSI|nr:Transcription factor TFIIIB component B'' [Gossypium australe]
MKDCPKARAVLEYGGLNNRLLVENFTSCIDCRNNCVFRGEDEEARITWERVSCLSNDFRIFNMIEAPMLPVLNKDRGWKKPKLGVIKVNFDAALQDNKACYGLVARDHDGFVLGGLCQLVNRFNKRNVDLTIMGFCMRHLFTLADSFLFFIFTWVPRSGNKAADMLCKLVKDNYCTVDFDVDYPLEIHDIILKDAIN